MLKTMAPIILSAGALAISAAAVAGNADFDIKSQGVKSVAVFGDSPYGTAPTDTAELTATPAFINAINADPDVSLVLHVGDIHSGSQYCTESYNRLVYDLWTNFRSPLVYTPGDNEWADCHKAKEGGGTYNASTARIDYKRDANGNLINYAGGNPVANLDLIRSIFFAIPGYSLGDSMRVLSQSEAFDEDGESNQDHRGESKRENDSGARKHGRFEREGHPSDRKYVENVMWGESKTLFVTINVPGGSNNDSDVWFGAPTETQEQKNERDERTGADLRWLDAAFARAKTGGFKAVVIQTQADMWDLDGKTASHIARYKPFIDNIAAHTKDFGKPVLLFNGDSHVYRSDNPLMKGAPCVIESSASAGSEIACGDDAYDNQPGGYQVPNFHRVVVHGSTFALEWLKLTISPRANAANGANAFGPFGWQRMIQQ